jgi:hypothetical protein
LLRTEASHEAEIISIAEYPKTKYKKEKFANIFKGCQSNKTNLHSIIKRAAKVVKQFSQ